jgi:malate synthase
MGGMSAFIPIRGDEEANALALEKVREDKKREAANGHDGTWVAHPGLIDLAVDAFSEYMPKAHQKDKLSGIAHSASALLELPEGGINLADFDSNIQVALRYTAAWLGGTGAVPIFNMMEDAATAEISRAQLWQWMQYATTLSDGVEIDAALFANRLQSAVNAINADGELTYLSAAADMLDSLVNSPDMADFLTTGAYALID